MYFVKLSVTPEEGGVYFNLLITPVFLFLSDTGSKGFLRKKEEMRAGCAASSLCRDHGRVR